MSRIDGFLFEERSERPFFAVLFCCFVVFAIHISTVMVSPIVWQDEVQIVDMGHGLLSPEDPSSIDYLNDESKMLPQFSYWGCALHELCYRTFQCFSAPRICSLVFLIFLSVICFFWIKLSCKSSTIAAICSLLLLFDPQLTQSARGGRCDSEALFFLVCAAYFFEYGVQHLGKLKYYFSFFLCGFFLVCGFCFWITAAFTGLFWIAYMLSAVYRAKMVPSTVCKMVLFGVFGVMTAMLLSMALYPESLSFMFSSPTCSSAVGKISFAKIFHLVKSFRYSIHFFAGLFLFWTMGKKWIWGCACIFTIVLLMFTPIYIHRMHYLYLFSILFIAFFLKKHAVFSQKKWKNIIAACLMLCFGYTVIGRFSTAVLNHDKRSIKLLSKEIAQSKLSTIGPSSVYLAPYSLYYIAREMNLNYLRLYDRASEEQIENFILTRNIEYIVTQHKELPEHLAEKYLLLEALKSKASLYGEYFIFRKVRSPH